jgi:hypothetical protein
MTQFVIRDPRVGLYLPVLRLAEEATLRRQLVKVAGTCGATA